ncbi:flagellar hook-length control protein FliK [Povalibacter uvarum]|uniref:Flagellar hook-length control protein FliK n=1 Tax=Povalibacter uvarum TaxID=732238 RepID=A0A841HPQ1_9GAMM|nr:flagellar hook-length control protein FliK [Povalibacter uvarum]MBB6094220.1 flagellar hook-length control protein FliK [Povalibacter uvarum]
MSTPMLPATTPASPTAAPVGETTTGVPADDFMLMLGQLLGAPVAKATQAKPTLTPATDVEGDAAQALQDAAALAGVPLPVPVTLPAQQNAATQAMAAEVLPLAGGEGGAARSSVASMTADALAATLAETPAEVDNQAPTSPNPLHAQPMDAAQLRAAATVVEAGPTRTLHHHVGSSAWADELGTRMLLMSERGQHSASLRLSPEHLGPLEVRIAVRDDQASVWFGSAQADTRAALEQALPRLRELFASQGLSLSDAGVFHESPREQAKQGGANGTTLPGGGTEAEVSASAMAVKLGLVDAYA